MLIQIPIAGRVSFSHHNYLYRRKLTTVETMYATSLIKQPTGPHKCFYCGAPASNPLVLSSTFVDWWTVAQPESRQICDGCLISIDEKISIKGKDKPQKTRGYSWLVELEKRTSYTKANKKEIYAHLLNPPKPPWAFAIAESGQKHLLYRTPINQESEPPFIVQLELEQIVYTPVDLLWRVTLAMKVVAAVGHKGAADPGVGLALAGNPELAEKWFEVYREPLTRLAMFVCPSQEECKKNADRNYQDA